MNVTASNGDLVSLNPDHLFMLTGPLSTDRVAVFYLYVGGTPVQIAGTMDAFVSGLPPHTYTELHFASNGQPFYARGSLVSSATPATPAQKAKRATANAMIVLGGKERLITETFPAAVAAINLAGGNL